MNRLDAFEAMTNLEVTQRYRLDHNGIEYINELIGDAISPRTVGLRPVTSIEKILLALRYYASGELQVNDGDIHRLSQPTVSRAVAQVTDQLSGIDMQRFIRFPVNERQLEMTKQDFEGIAHFPNVIGVIDGTQVQIAAPHHEEDAYVNRMGYHSINTQIIFDGQDTIIDLVARWPGSTHDSRMLRESSVFQLLEQGHVQQQPGTHSYLLGDSGYPCKQWLLMPYLHVHPAPGSQTEFNRAHKKTRSKVEQGIGQLKRRWGVLHSEIRLQPEKVCRVIIACGVLHNICKARGIAMVDDGPAEADNNIQHEYVGPENGLQYRDFIANNYF